MWARHEQKFIDSYSARFFTNEINTYDCIVIGLSGTTYSENNGPYKLFTITNLDTLYTDITNMLVIPTGVNKDTYAAQYDLHMAWAHAVKSNRIYKKPEKLPSIVSTVVIKEFDSNINKYRFYVYDRFTGGLTLSILSTDQLNRMFNYTEDTTTPEDYRAISTAQPINPDDKWAEFFKKIYTYDTANVVSFIL